MTVFLSVSIIIGISPLHCSLDLALLPALTASTRVSLRTITHVCIHSITPSLPITIQSQLLSCLLLASSHTLYVSVHPILRASELGGGVSWQEALS